MIVFSENSVNVIVLYEPAADCQSEPLEKTVTVAKTLLDDKIKPETMLISRANCVIMALQRNRMSHRDHIAPFTKTYAKVRSRDASFGGFDKNSTKSESDCRALMPLLTLSYPQ